MKNVIVLLVLLLLCLCGCKDDEGSRGGEEYDPLLPLIGTWSDVSEDMNEGDEVLITFIERKMLFSPKGSPKVEFEIISITKKEIEFERHKVTYKSEYFIDKYLYIRFIESEDFRCYEKL